jgi:phospholipid/cholesterol/gamma-HCH transport system substrate-binding protein
MYDIRGLADVSDIYNAAAPDLLRTLRNLNVTSQTIVDKKTQIESLIPAVTAVSDKGTRFVGDNTNKIIGVNIASRAGLELAATYSPELPCVFKGLMKLKPRVESAVGGRNPMVNLTVEIVKPRPAYKKIDLPEVKDYRKPRCYGLPNPKVPFPDYVTLDGTEDDQWWKDAGNSGVPDTDPIATTSGNTSGSPTSANAPGSTPGNRDRALSEVFLQPGTDLSDQDVIKNVVAPLLQVPADQVPDVAALIFGPVLHGGVATVK